VFRYPLLLLCLLSAALSPAIGYTESSATTAIARAALPRSQPTDFGEAPAVPAQPLSDRTKKALTAMTGSRVTALWGSRQFKALETIGKTRDARLAWIVTDVMRFTADRDAQRSLNDALGRLLGVRLRGADVWGAAVNRLIAWDIPAPPDYLRYKAAVYTRISSSWAPLLQEGKIDWRHVSWGGVSIDDRPFGDTDLRCNCIPAADNPAVTSAAAAGWLADDAIVFGLSINGEHRAYPRRIMEVREMVNDTLGGRNLGIPYCTLCGSAQAWFTDQLPEGVERPVLRTSGLLIRSNKVMYDLTTQSVFDTFTGRAVTGPLGSRGLQLAPASVITTTWGEWQQAHPDTTVLAEYLALGRDFDFRNGRDADGPIFPIGDLDPRLAAQEEVLGVLTATGEPLAFHVPSVIAALDAGEQVATQGVQVVLEAGGVRALGEDGQDLGTHQAFWFAWSQFHKGTALWPAAVGSDILPP
jgi:hypothetical protein